jgi:hypothetical protein
MKTAPTRNLFAYWNARRGSRLAPERGDIEPGAIREILGDSFIITFDPADDHPFRLAGTRVCGLFGRELKSTPFVHLFDLESRERIRGLAATVADEANPVVAGVAARTAEGSDADLELLLLPLYHRGKMRVRLLGVLAPVVVPYWLGAECVVTLALGAARHLGGAIATAEAPQFAKAQGKAANKVPGGTARPRPNLTVHDGGRN